MRRLPLWPTLLVAAAAAVMVALGIWQLQRAQWKEGLLAEYEAAANKSAVAWPAPVAEGEAPLFRRSSVNCIKPVSWRSAAGRNARGQAGYVHIASCRTGGAEGPGAQVVAGWSQRPEPPQWEGGAVSGVIAPDSKYVIRLVADTPVAGLARAQPPSPEDIPNNHIAYAVQWFAFAGIALVIYWLALRRREREASADKDKDKG